MLILLLILFNGSANKFNDQTPLELCGCTVRELSTFNDKFISPLIEKIISRIFFRFYKLTWTECQFWEDDSVCRHENCCEINSCSENEVPELIKENKLNTFISNESKEIFEMWKVEDEDLDFCNRDDSSDSGEYYDLQNNPEKYTGYSGPSTWRIWNAIYKDNCFSENEERCLEKDALTNLISGLHLSINIHLCGKYFFDNVFPNTWGPNVKEFYRRFYKNGNLKEEVHKWINNLHLLYAVELRAIAKAANYLGNISFMTGNSTDDKLLMEDLTELLENSKKFTNHFNESLFFVGQKFDLKKEFQKRFKNISLLMNCVGCDKCRLWGKLQITGIGTALKILFSDHIIKKFEKDRDCNEMQITLERQEIVSLFQSFGRLSESLRLFMFFSNEVESNKKELYNEL